MSSLRRCSALKISAIVNKAISQEILSADKCIMGKKGESTHTFLCSNKNKSLPLQSSVLSSCRLDP